MTDGRVTAQTRYASPPDAYDNQLGEAVLVDGQWKNSRAAFGRAIQQAGVTCPEV